MSGWPARALGAAAWVAVVAVGAVLVWLVISRAGAGLVADAGPITAPTSAAPTDGSTTASPDAARRASWQGESGVVTAACRGGDIALVGAQPEDGMLVKERDGGPEQVVIEFSGDDEPAVVVTARCRDGRPQFSVTHPSSSASTSEGSSSDGPTSPASPSGADDHGGDDSSGHGSGHGSDDGSSDD